MPKLVDADMQRRAIARAAIDVIGASGLESTRLRDVARAAGVTTGAVTHYFDGKDEVLLAALDDIVQRILKRAPKPTPGLRLGDALFEIAYENLPLDPERRTEWRVWLAFWGGAMGDERHRARHRDYYVRMVGQLAEALATVGGMSPEDANRRADAIVAAVDGIGARATLEPEFWPAPRQREALATLLKPLLANL